METDSSPEYIIGKLLNVVVEAMHLAGITKGFLNEHVSIYF